VRGGDGEEKTEISEDESERSPSLESFMMHYLEDSMLWPIVIVVIGHAVALASFALLLAVRERRPSAMMATALLLYMSFLGIRWEYRRHGNLKAITWLLLVTWLLSGLTAYLGHTYKFL
jgi:hypothetical protein